MLGNNILVLKNRTKSWTVHSLHMSATNKAAHPMQRGIDYLDYTTETTKKFIEVVNDKYASCLKDKSIGKEIKKLQYTLKLANLKVKELEQNVQNDYNDAEVVLKKII